MSLFFRKLEEMVKRLEEELVTGEDKCGEYEAETWAEETYNKE